MTIARDDMYNYKGPKKYRQLIQLAADKIKYKNIVINDTRFSNGRVMAEIIVDGRSKGWHKFPPLPGSTKETVEVYFNRIREILFGSKTVSTREGMFLQRVAKKVLARQKTAKRFDDDLITILNKIIEDHKGLWVNERQAKIVSSKVVLGHRADTDAIEWALTINKDFFKNGDIAVKLLSTKSIAGAYYLIDRKGVRAKADLVFDEYQVSGKNLSFKRSVNGPNVLPSKMQVAKEKNAATLQLTAQHKNLILATPGWKSDNEISSFARQLQQGRPLTPEQLTILDKYRKDIGIPGRIRVYNQEYISNQYENWKRLVNSAKERLFQAARRVSITSTSRAYFFSKVYNAALLEDYLSSTTELSMVFSQQQVTRAFKKAISGERIGKKSIQFLNKLMRRMNTVNLNLSIAENVLYRQANSKLRLKKRD